VKSEAPRLKRREFYLTAVLHGGEQAGQNLIFFWIPACAEMTIKKVISMSLKYCCGGDSTPENVKLFLCEPLVML
jgi:hypothetical protein